jgi:hypothetical protein
MVGVNTFFKGIRGHSVDLFADGAEMESWLAQDPLDSEILIVVLDEDVGVKHIEVGLDVVESGLVKAFEKDDGYLL